MDQTRPYEKPKPSELWLKDLGWGSSSFQRLVGQRSQTFLKETTAIITTTAATTTTTVTATTTRHMQSNLFVHLDL